jgi:hypothetical protein
VRRTILALLTALALLTTCGAAAADTEPNDGITQAEGPLKGGTDYAGTLSTDNDRDWYVFYASSQSQLDIAFTHVASPACCDADVRLLDTDGNSIDSTGPDENETGHIKYTTPMGTNRFFLVVDGSLNAKYQFRIDPGSAVVEGPRWDSATETGEPNESRTQSMGPLNGGVLYGGSFQTDNDEDWFHFHTLGRREFDVSVLNTSGPNIGEVQAVIYDRGGQRLASLGSDPNEIRHFRLTSPSGITPYYLQLRGDTNGTWQFRIDPADALTSKPFEPCLQARRDEKDARKLYNLYVKRSKTSSKRSTRRAYKKRAAKQKKKLDAAVARVALECS